MGDTSYHARLAKAIREGVLSEYKAERYPNVGYLAIKALEQAIEACAATEGLHFHEHPRTAHIERRRWLDERHPDLVEAWDELWAVYGELGYLGRDGDRAEGAVRSLNRALATLEREEGVDLSTSGERKNTEVRRGGEH